ncbi:dephospho-CoA kinase [Rheinheimera sp.]|uniref:dephospho-CoA kinase n=1 Tax=Rheinheimera sp. TaxID=1869214 RepID=UPI00307D5A4A
MSQFIVGLTGGIGSGKSTVECFFQQLGIQTVDADLIARQVVEPGQPALQQIIDHFGARLQTAEGLLDRAALRDIIFANPEAKAWLNQLLHPLIRQQLLQQLAQCQSVYAILTAPLLLENGLQQYCDQVLVVDVPEQVQIERTVQRDQVSEQQVRSILASQYSRAQRRELADQLIDNHQSLRLVEQRVRRLDELYRQLAEEKLAKA